MKTLTEIRELFVDARTIAKEASPARCGEAAEKLKGISDHCKELYERSSSYLERAKCRNLYESIDNVISILGVYGFCDATVAAFFGLNNAQGPSFADISSGRGTVLKRDMPPVVEEPSSSDKPAAPAEPVSAAGGGIEMPPPPTEAAPVTAESPAEPTSPDAAGGDVAGNGQLPVESGDSLSPNSLDEFIGQAHIVKRLKEEIAAAKVLGHKYIDNVMLFGNKGLGKTTLMKLLAKELGVDFYFIDGTTFPNNNKAEENFHSIFLRIIEADRPCVIAVDEIHGLKGLQSRLLTLLESRMYVYVADGETRSVPIKDFTFIGATTDYQSVLGTIKDRCSNLTFVLKDYTREELMQIMKNKLSALGLSASELVIGSCVNRCRSSIREIKAIALGLRTKAIVHKTNVVTKELADLYFADRGLDPIGLNEKELEILNIIKNEQRGSISSDTLAARAYLDPAILTQEYEPFLLKIGFISVNSRGRTLTQKGADYLKYGYYDFGGGYTIGQRPDPQADSDTPDEPTPAEPTPAEPTPAEPTPAEPTPAEPTPAAPAQAEESKA